MSLINVTAPLRARARPFTVTLSLSADRVSAKMLPANVDPVPSVAELGTSQKTLHAWAPFVRTTLLLDPVISDEPVLMMKTES